MFAGSMLAFGVDAMEHVSVKLQIEVFSFRKKHENMPGEYRPNCSSFEVFTKFTFHMAVAGSLHIWKKSMMEFRHENVEGW